MEDIDKELIDSMFQDMLEDNGFNPRQNFASNIVGFNLKCLVILEDIQEISKLVNSQPYLELLDTLRKRYKVKVINKYKDTIEAMAYIISY